MKKAATNVGATAPDTGGIGLAGESLTHASKAEADATVPQQNDEEAQSNKYLNDVNLEDF